MGRTRFAASIAGLLAAAGLGCTTFHLAPALSPGGSDARECALPVTTRSVAIAMPTGLTEFVYEADLEGRDISYAFGEAVRDPLTRLLTSCFGAPPVRLTADRLTLSQAASRLGPEPDYTGLVRFNRISMTATRTSVFVEVGLELVLLGRNGGDQLAIDGDGIGRARFYSSGGLRAAGRDALARALESLRDRIEEWAGLLAPSSGETRSPTR